MKEECAFCNGSKVELVDGLGVPCVWCDPVGTAIAEDKIERDGVAAAPVAAPVPPAGDVECAICLSLGDQCVTCEESEFKAWAEKHFASPDYSQTSAGVYIKDWMRHSFAAWQARSKVVTRLTAKRDGPLADLDAWKVTAETFEDFYKKTEAELTKALELLCRLERAGLRTKAQGIEVRAYLAHQSTPAAKGEPRTAVQQKLIDACKSAGFLE